MMHSRLPSQVRIFVLQKMFMYGVTEVIRT